MKAELLAPAGSYGGLRAAIAAGADAVYIGGQRFGARAYAQNAEKDELQEAIDYAHIHGRKIYLTVNTLLKETELQHELYEYLAPYYEQGVDAAIVQDLGVLKFIKKEFPKLPIHASTQMAVTGPLGAALLKKEGVSRIVTARELSLEDIKGIREEAGVELESFVHGALCYSCSGMCLFSSMLGGRSGNRGRCAQPCRLPYEVYENKKRLNSNEEAYLLSPKDMCTIDILPEILAAGVYSLKIEGRMKKPEYAAGVTRIYRKYLDILERGETYRVSREDRQELLDLYQRDGFNQGYYHIHGGREMMAAQNEKRKAKSGVSRNEELFRVLKNQYIDTKKQERIYGNLILFSNSPAILNLEYGNYSVQVQGEMVLPAENQPLSEERIRKQMEKTGNTPFQFARLEINTDEMGFLPMQSLNELRRNGLEFLEMEILKTYRRSRTESVKVPHKISKSMKTESCRLTASVETWDQFSRVLEQDAVDGIYCDWPMFGKENFLEKVKETGARVEKQGKAFYLMLPYLLRNPEEKRLELQLKEVKTLADGFLVRNLESLGLLLREGLSEKAICDASLYTWNQEGLEFLNGLGVQRTTIPLELNGKEVKQRDNHQSEWLVYGYYPMMISAQCLKKNFGTCDHKCRVLELKDRYGATFLTKCICDFCYNVIYNSIPTGLLKEGDELEKIMPNSVRLSFTTESGKQTGEILELFLDRYKKKKEISPELPPFTKGHYKRGVE